MKFIGRKKKKEEQEKEAELQLLIRKELEEFQSDDELLEKLKNIQRNKVLKEKWDALSKTKKIQLLRYVQKKRERSDGKK